MKKLLFAAIVLTGCQEVRNNINPFFDDPIDSCGVCLDIGENASSIAVLHGHAAVSQCKAKYNSKEYQYYDKMADSLSIACDSMFLLYDKCKHHCK
jgi:hypothetical protein